jgi:MSHA biogenesis protein MshG
MIEIGEEGQSLDNTLHEVARHYDAEVDYELARFNKLIEPILLVALGGIVLILVLGIYFPMWDLIKVAQI